MPSPFRISVSSDFKSFESAYGEHAAKQVNFAAAVALTKSAQAGQAAAIKRMSAVFDRPTPATLNALRVVPAKRDHLEATVLIKDFIGKGPAPQNWLGAEIEGGDRQHKRSENALIRAGVMQADQFWTPGDALDGRLDSYGNVPSGMVTQILSRVSALGEQGYKANVSGAMKRKLRKAGKATRATGTNFFVWRDSDGRAKAIMELLGKGHVEPVLWFTDRTPAYSKRFAFTDIVLAEVGKTFAPEMAKALEMALRTARD